ncbi:Adenosine deaminase-like protein [Frankliniella fusca]|uniref:Adenosine deaminase-like protein n=1 Tax=Frankliniella fusca TaxID=407009 RepID=A0AAE1LQA0_9NEOP|nr:Adenosine deaminase-like protein [Frankliniella fusca]
MKCLGSLTFKFKQAVNPLAFVCYRFRFTQELHAHLNGSLSEDTLRDLFMENPDLKSDERIKSLISSFLLKSRSLEECFKKFEIAHAVTVTPAAVKRATKDVISDFAADGVAYLELRTTPRSVPGIMSKSEYVQAVVDTIKDVQAFNSSDKFIIVKLLLSINRQESPIEAEENVRKAIEANAAYPDIVVGVDLSGNPKYGDVVRNILPLLTEARKSGLKVVLHCAEIPNENEVEEMLKFNADRLGHGTCVHPSYGGSEKLWRLLLDSKTPLEVCLTSNVKCKTVETYENHHLRHLLQLQHPFAISTDDKGVFSTSLSKEFELAAKTFNLSSLELCNCVAMAINASFASTDEKNELMSKLSAFKIERGLG